ncbi:MAG: magnesium chelatase subunit D [Pseudomonadota bacterium]
MRDLNDGYPAPSSGAPKDGAEVWARAGLAAVLLAIDPRGLRGAVLRARPGHARDAWLEGLRALMGDAAPWHRLPPGCGAAPLLPRLDLAATLAEGRAIEAPGLLTRAAAGVLVVPGAERLERGVVGSLTQGLEGAAAPTVIAFDEGAEAEERVAPALGDRLAFALGLDALPLGAVSPLVATLDDVRAAQAMLSDVAVPDDALAALVAMAAGMGIGSARPPTMALAAARAHAALHGRAAVAEEDAAIASELVLLPRALWLPGAEEEQAPEEQPPQDSEPEDGEAQAPEGEAEALEDRLLEAVRASLPPEVLAALLAGNRQRTGGAAGSAGAQMATPRRGRPAGVRQGLPGGHRRLALVETLSAAAPWQPLRRRTRAGSAPGNRRLEIRRDDLRIRRFKAPRETLTIFVVDASGSAAIARLAEAKGAVELMLGEAYRRRDSVALVAFRKEGAALLLPPTRALARARKALAALPGGGGTPIAAGLDVARRLAEDARRRGQSVGVVLLSDGRANIARDGTPGRGPAQADAEAAARGLAATGAASLVIDTSARAARTGARARPEARSLADAMSARYLALPGAGAESIAGAAGMLSRGSDGARR